MSKLNHNISDYGIEYSTGLMPRISIDPIMRSFTAWKPYNKTGERIEVVGRTGTIIKVDRPVYMDEVERITVKFDDDSSEEQLPIRGIRIGQDWIR